MGDSMRDKKGRFVKGHSASPKTQFKKGQHWREKRPWWQKEWLEKEYLGIEKSTGEIAKEHGVTDGAIIFWLKKHNIERRTISEARAIKKWGQCGSDNPMWNRRGELNPRWLGGVTPERQGFYTSKEWKEACSYVWKRDGAICQRCGLHREDSLDMPFHIHHLTSFANKELRAEVDNLILLCEACHLFVHSKRNKENEFISQV